MLERPTCCRCRQFGSFARPARLVESDESGRLVLEPEKGITSLAMPDTPLGHLVNVGPSGTFKRSGAARTSPADVDDIVKGIREQRADRVVVHFHGGLVSEARGLEIVRRLEPIYAGAGAYAIGVVWESGLVETIERNLGTLNRTKLFNKLVNYAIRHVAQRLGAGVGVKGAGAPMSLEEVEAARASDIDLERLDAQARSGVAILDEADVEAAQPELELEIQADLDADTELEAAVAEASPAPGLLDPKVVAELEEGGKGIVSTVAAARLIARVATRSLRRFVRGRDHGVVATVVEEVLREAYIADLGAWVWSGMKDAATVMWKPNEGDVGEATHAGSYLLAALADLQASQPEIKIDLVAHSAGSIAIAELLKTAAVRHPDFAVRNVVLLAPAATAKVFKEGILDQQHRFDTFRMFTMDDALECKDRLVPGVYPRSLLYFVSGVLEDEPDASIVGLARHTAGTAPYDGPPLAAVHQYLSTQGASRLILARTQEGAGPGLQTWAVKHGDFDDDPHTLESVAALIRS
jgi:Alpha/beta hydrolase of unknown function (DUF900)